MEATIKKETLNNELYYDNQLMVKITIEYPQISANAPDEGAVAFNRYYQEEAVKLSEVGEDTLYPDAVAQYQYDMQQGYPFNSYELVQDYTITYNKLPIISLYRDVYTYTGGAHGLTQRTGDTWEMTESALLDLRDLFVEGYDYNDIILKIIRVEATARQERGEVDYFDDYLTLVETYYDEDNFYLSDKGIVIYYPLYSIAPYASGIQEFLIPYRIFGKNLVIPKQKKKAMWY